MTELVTIPADFKVVETFYQHEWKNMFDVFFGGADEDYAVIGILKECVDTGEIEMLTMAELHDRQPDVWMDIEQDIKSQQQSLRQVEGIGEI